MVVQFGGATLSDKFKQSNPSKTIKQRSTEGRPESHLELILVDFNRRRSLNDIFMTQPLINLER